MFLGSEVGSDIRLIDGFTCSVGIVEAGCVDQVHPTGVFVDERMDLDVRRAFKGGQFDMLDLLNVEADEDPLQEVNSWPTWT